MAESSELVITSAMSAKLAEIEAKIPEKVWNSFLHSLIDSALREITATSAGDVVSAAITPTTTSTAPANDNDIFR